MKYKGAGCVLKTKSKYLNKKSIFISWLLSYMVILMIPFMINIFVYTQSISIINQEVNKANLKSLDQFKQVIDYRINEVRRLSTEISFNEKVNGLLGYKETFDTHHIRTFVDIIKDIGTYKVANSFIDDLYIFYKNNNFVLGINGKCTADEFYEFYCKDYGVSYDDWIKMLSTKDKGNYQLIMNSYNQQALNKIILLNPLPIAYTDNPEGNIVITLSKDLIKEALKDIKWGSKGVIIIVDKDNHIITTTEEVDFENEVINSKEIKENTSVFEKTIEGRKMIISLITSETTGWKIISIIPEKVLLEKIKYVKTIIIISMGVCLIIGGLIAYYLCKNHYKPVKRIITLLKDKTVIISEEENSEFYYIEKSLSKFMDDKVKMSKQLDNQKDLLRENVLRKLLKGNSNDHLLEKQGCYSCGINFKHENFFVFLAHINKNSQFFNECLTEGIEKPWQLARFIIRNVIEEQVNLMAIGYMVDIDNTLGCVVNIDKEDLSLLIDEGLLKSKIMIEQEFHINFSISISHAHKGYKEIFNAYEEAVDVLQYNIIRGENDILLYDDMISSELKDSGADLDDYRILINTLKAGDYIERKHILDSIIEKDFSLIMPLQIMRCKIYGLMNVLYMAMEESCNGCKKELFEELKPIEKLLQCDTIYKIKNNMYDILKQIDSYINTNQEQNDNIIDHIMTYVNDHYQEVNLSVSMLADTYRINSSYLSRSFKKQVGIGLLDYIHKTRISHAKELINSTSMNLNEIYSLVGYYNSMTFTRAFKRYENITPSQYRTINK